MNITSLFERYFIDSATNLPATGMAVWLVPQSIESPSYPGDYLVCTPHATRDGVYYREQVPDGEYKVYIDVAGGTTPVLYDENIWLGENRVSYFVETYIKRHVEIEGTEDSPEEFTTNSGKLAEDEDENVFPTVDSDTHNYWVELLPYNEATIRKNQESLVDGNVHFHATHSEAGADAGDGKYYADFKLCLQRKRT
jgi:hypothetical protein